jgi:hypothetical protein
LNNLTQWTIEKKIGNPNILLMFVKKSKFSITLKIDLRSTEIANITVVWPSISIKNQNKEC